MTDVLLLGSFHFKDSKKDFYSFETQEELNSLAQTLLRFSPDAVAVESAAHQQAAVNAAYQKFSLCDLQNADKMRNETLGEIQMFNNIGPLRYNNETVQIGFRIAGMQGLSEVYAIDDDSEIDGEVFEHPSLAMQEAMKNFFDYDGECENTIADMFRHVNSAEWSFRNHQVYLRANEVGNHENYLGTRMLAQWYERNLKIFSNIQRLAEQHSRIFVVYGAGHLQILRDLICADSRLRLADVMQYLPVSELKS
ncbi:MAG: hypothetical protein J1E35_10395 [Lachnospiraceae bacterium]|nr:hypothetical protein [Lachnospiraceae bacterium]